MIIKSVIFIGMAGVGKSSIGKEVAHHFKLQFIDTDKQIARDQQLPLNEVIDHLGIQKFNELEAEYVQKSIDHLGIVSPGGSFIYSTDCIHKIRNDVIFIYLFDEPDNIKARIANIETRGIVGLKEKTFEELCFERHDLYKSVANIQFNINHFGFDQVTNQIIQFLGQFFNDPFKP
jgi:shikimate kinase